MKRFTLIIILMLLLVAVLPASAQDDSNIITLNDATPAVNIVITLPANTTGTIAVNFTQAAVSLTDQNEAVVFSAADARLHGLELNIAPNSGTHTLTVERLPGVAEAYVSVTPLAEMTLNGMVSLVDQSSLNLNQEIALTLNGDSPGGNVAITIPTETVGAITATFPGASATSQLVDSTGMILAESVGGHVDGATFIVDAGDYGFTVLGNGLNTDVIADIRVVSAQEGGFAVIDAPSVASVAGQASNTTCSATITASSVNLRSGPGTGYTLLDYGYRGETFPVGGQNPENNWIVIGTDDGSAWLAMSLAELQGNCEPLTVFNIPLRYAQPPQVSITTTTSGLAAQQGPSSGSYDDDDDDDREDDDREYENEEDDD